MINHSIYVLGRTIRGYLFRLIHQNHFIGTGRLLIDRQSNLILDTGSKIEIAGTLRINENKIISTPRVCLIRLDKEANLLTNGNTRIFYGGDIIIFERAKLEIGDSFINSDTKIRCHKHIKIGNGCAISHEVTIMDSNAHLLNGNRHTREVIIGNHVWIGTRATILNGVHIGDGAVIAAGSVVTSDIPEGSLAGGVPARVLRESVSWSM